MTTIKLVPGRMAQLRQTLKSEENRLQETANQVARIAASLDMELKARQGIDSGLEQVRQQLRQQAQNMATMVTLANTAQADLAGKDEDLASQADQLLYTLRQMLEGAGAAGGVGAAGGIGTAGGLFDGILKPALNLSSLLDLDSLFGIGSLFTGMDDKIRDALQEGVNLDLLNPNFDNKTLPDLIATVGGLGLVGSSFMSGGIGTLLGLLDGAGSTSSGTQSSSSKKTSSQSQSSSKSKPSSKEKKKETKKKGFWDKLGDAASNAWDDAKDMASDAWDGAKDMASDAAEWASDTWEDTKDWAADAWEDTKDFAADTWEDTKDLASDAWGGIKKVAQSKPMGYVWEMGGSLLGGLADLGSFCGNVQSGNMVGAAADTYGFLDNFFAFSQDMTALGIYGLGAGCESLGIGGDDVMDYTIQTADELSGRDGIVEEVRNIGWDPFTDTVEAVDTSVNVYKFVNGLKNLKDNPLFHLKDAKDGEGLKALFELSGWKIPSSSGSSIGDKIGYFDDFFSNLDLGYKYVDGFISETGLKSLWENTVPGKIINGPGKIVESITEPIQRLE